MSQLLESEIAARWFCWSQKFGIACFKYPVLQNESKCGLLANLRDWIKFSLYGIRTLSSERSHSLRLGSTYSQMMFRVTLVFNWMHEHTLRVGFRFDISFKRIFLSFTCKDRRRYSRERARNRSIKYQSLLYCWAKTAQQQPPRLAFQPSGNDRTVPRAVAARSLTCNVVIGAAGKTFT